MRKFNSLYIKKIAGIFTAAACALFVFYGCNAPEEDKPITISSIDLSSSNVNQGETITVTINATDEEGRTLNYNFDATGGDFYPYDITSNVATWAAPISNAGNFTITGKAYAGEDEASSSVTVTVTSLDEPLISFIYPTEELCLTAINHDAFSFQAFHNNGISESQGLEIHFYNENQQNDDLIDSTISITNPSGDLKTYIISFDIDLDNIYGACRLEYQVQSRISEIDSQLVEVNFTVEGVTTDY